MSLQLDKIEERFAKIEREIISIEQRFNNSIWRL